MSRPIVLVCGPVGDLSWRHEDLPVHTLPARPSRTEVDPVLAGLAGRRLLVCGTDADLAAVVIRLVRTERLAEVELAFLPTAESAFAALWGLPTEPLAALRLAEQGASAGTPFLRDDSGGVLVGRGVLAPVTDGVAYCDDVKVLRGNARSLEVSPDETDGLRVRITGRWRRQRTATGRALQLGFAEARPVCDGVVHPRAVQRWTWYRHTEDLRLVRVRNQKR